MINRLFGSYFACSIPFNRFMHQRRLKVKDSLSRNRGNKCANALTYIDAKLIIELVV